MSRKTRKLKKNKSMKMRKIRKSRKMRKNRGGNADIYKNKNYLWLPSPPTPLPPLPPPPPPPPPPLKPPKQVFDSGISLTIVPNDVQLSTQSEPFSL